MIRRFLRLVGICAGLLCTVVRGADTSATEFSLAVQDIVQAQLIAGIVKDNKIDLSGFGRGGKEDETTLLMLALNGIGGDDATAITTDQLVAMKVAVTQSLQVLKNFSLDSLPESMHNAVISAGGTSLADCVQDIAAQGDELITVLAQLADITKEYRDYFKHFQTYSIVALHYDRETSIADKDPFTRQQQVHRIVAARTVLEGVVTKSWLKRSTPLIDYVATVDKALTHLVAVAKKLEADPQFGIDSLLVGLINTLYGQLSDLKELVRLDPAYHAEGGK